MEELKIQFTEDELIEMFSDEWLKEFDVETDEQRDRYYFMHGFVTVTVRKRFKQ